MLDKEEQVETMLGEDAGILLKGKEQSRVMEDPKLSPAVQVDYLQTWDKYVRDFLVGCSHVSAAGIYNHKGEELAATENFFVNDAQFTRVMQGYTVADTLFDEEIIINDRMYRVKLSDGSRGIFAKTFEIGQGVFSCSIYKTGQVVIIAVSKPRMCYQECNLAVARLGDFLVSRGL